MLAIISSIVPSKLSAICRETRHNTQHTNLRYNTASQCASQFTLLGFKCHLQWPHSQSSPRRLFHLVSVRLQLSRSFVTLRENAALPPCANLNSREALQAAGPVRKTGLTGDAARTYVRAHIRARARQSCT